MAQHIELKTSGISWGKKVDREVRRLWNDQKNYTDDEMTRDENLYGKNGLFENIVNFEPADILLKEAGLTYNCEETNRWILNEIMIKRNKKFREMVDEVPYCAIELNTKSPHSFVIDKIYLVG
jgi:hypothetical protein